MHAQMHGYFYKCMIAICFDVLFGMTHRTSSMIKHQFLHLAILNLKYRISFNSLMMSSL